MTNKSFLHFYVIRTDQWDNFYFDSRCAYCAKVMHKCEKIVVTIFEMCLKAHPQDKMLLRIKIHKWNEFQEQFGLSHSHQAKLLFLAKLCQGNTAMDKFKQ